MHSSLGHRLVLIVTLVLSGSGSMRSQVRDFTLTLNEIDPFGGEQFIEIHNRGANVVSLEEYSIAIANIDGKERAVVQLPATPLEPLG